VSAVATEAATTTTTDQGTVSEEGSKEPPAAPKAPESYSEFVGNDGKPLDAERAEQFTKTAKEMNLTQEQAQQLVKLGLGRDDAMKARIEEASTKWLSELPSDKEFGGEKLSENLAIAKTAIAAFGSPELTALLNETKLGNHPEIIRAFYRAGKQLSPDNRFIQSGSGGESTTKEPAKALYPSQGK
jgi:hypothetical protein